ERTARRAWAVVTGRPVAAPAAAGAAPASAAARPVTAAHTASSPAPGAGAGARPAVAELAAVGGAFDGVTRAVLTAGSGAIREASRVSGAWAAAGDTAAGSLSPLGRALATVGGAFGALRRAAASAWAVIGGPLKSIGGGFLTGFAAGLLATWKLANLAWDGIRAAFDAGMRVLRSAGEVLTATFGPALAAAAGWLRGFATDAKTVERVTIAYGVRLGMVAGVL